MNDAEPINPERVFRELSPRLPDDCILTLRLGLGRDLVRARPEGARGMMASLSGGLATMGSAVPYAIAAKFALSRAHRDRAASATARCR